MRGKTISRSRITMNKNMDEGKPSMWGEMTCRLSDGNRGYV